MCRHRTVIAVLLLTCAVARAAEPPEASSLVVQADPRIELLAAVQAISDYGDRTGLITRHDFPYKRQLIAHFEHFRGHRAVTLFQTMAREGFSFDAPVSAVLHYGPPPELAPIAPCNDEVVRRAGGRARLDAFFDALRDFAEVSSFMEFHEAHEPFYEEIARNVSSKVDAGDVAMLEDYYGVKQHGYRIIPAPLFHPGGFGPRIAHEDGRSDIFSVCGPRGAENDLPVFGTSDDFRYLVWHEFSHSFVNPVVDAHGEQVDARLKLMAPIGEAMRRQAYPQWRTCVYEHIVRAATCRFAFRTRGEAAGQKAVADEKKRSFLYIEPLCARLAEYEEQREEYPTLHDFFPELLAALDEALEKLPEIEATIPRVVRTVPETGARDVDPNLTELRVEFSVDMNRRGYSWTQRSDEEFPETTGRPRWISRRICVLPVELEPNHDYWIGLNAGRFTGFASADGAVAEAYILQFTTASNDGSSARTLGCHRQRPRGVGGAPRAR
ncbi:MAG: DUF4932 domain-containing protein [Planctomycetota bacterium]|nr:DUF4932 domain-containing protein [Planctomycetota bacterium]